MYLAHHELESVLIAVINNNNDNNAFQLMMI